MDEEKVSLNSSFTDSSTPFEVSTSQSSFPHCENSNLRESTPALIHNAPVCVRQYHMTSNRKLMKERRVNAFFLSSLQESPQYTILQAPQTPRVYQR